MQWSPSAAYQDRLGESQPTKSLLTGTAGELLQYTYALKDRFFVICVLCYSVKTFKVLSTDKYCQAGWNQGQTVARAEIRR